MKRALKAGLHVEETWVGLVYLLVIALFFFASFFVPGYGSQVLLVVFAVVSAYIGYKGYDFELFIKLLFAGCIVAGFSVLVIGVSDITAFMESISNAPEWLRIIDPHFYILYWYLYHPERHGFLVIRLAAAFTIISFIVGLISIALGYVISSIAARKR